MKVLYVEDNPANVFLVKRVARMGSHEIINYIDGDQALQKFDSIDPDLVLMDIQLAGDKSGLDVVKVLRERGIKTPIIAVTAYAMVGDKERCLEAGCDDYLAKPLPINRLVKIFQEYSEAAAQKVQATLSIVDSPAVDPVPVVTETASSIKDESQQAHSKAASTEFSEATVAQADTSKPVEIIETAKEEPISEKVDLSDVVDESPHETASSETSATGESEVKSETASNDVIDQEAVTEPRKPSDLADTNVSSEAAITDVAPQSKIKNTEEVATGEEI